MKKRRIDVIGAGISGFASAFQLSKFRGDVEIHVWEKDANPGGLAGTFTSGGLTIEKFYHHLFKKDVALIGLINELGLGPDLGWRPASTGAYYWNQPYRLSNPLDLLRFKPLSPAGRLRTGWMAIHARLVRDWRKLDDETAKEFVTRIAGPDSYRVLWEPVLRGKFGADAENISAAWLWSKLVDRGGSRDMRGHEFLGYLKGGLNRLFIEIEKRLRQKGHCVHYNAPVVGFQTTEGRITHIETRQGSFETDAVVSGAQLPDLTEILPVGIPEYKAELRSIRFLANVCLVLVLEKSLSALYWANICDTEAPFVGVIEHTRWVGTRDYSGKHVAYISSYVDPEDSRLSMTAQEVLENYRPHLMRLFPDFRSKEVLEAHLWKAQHAQPIVTTGYRNRRPEIQTPLDNLFVCTMAQIYPNDRQVSNGVEMAGRVATEVSRWLGVNQS